MKVPSVIYTDEERNQAIAAYQAGMPFKVIKQAYGFSRTALRYWIKQKGLERRPNGRPRTLVLGKEILDQPKPKLGSAAWMNEYMRMASESE